MSKVSSLFKEDSPLFALVPDEGAPKPGQFELGIATVSGRMVIALFCEHQPECDWFTTDFTRIGQAYSQAYSHISRAHSHREATCS